ncbi:hypothetical protein BD769DRAFT_679399 [Suillus cothurnatus]|nr:hypothetical protein BD769DRAFT_679399 [Suillus cothurnatus]
MWGKHTFGVTLSLCLCLSSLGWLRVEANCCETIRPPGPLERKYMQKELVITIHKYNVIVDVPVGQVCTTQVSSEIYRAKKSESRLALRVSSCVVTLIWFACKHLRVRSIYMLAEDQRAAEE